MSTITTTISPVTEPLKATEVDASSPTSISLYVASQEAHDSDISDNFVVEVNEVGSQMNVVAGEVNANAIIASDSADIAAASANNHGAWSNLTGAFPIGEAVNHSGYAWISNIAIADVTLSEPTDVNTDWTKTGGIADIFSDDTAHAQTLAIAFSVLT